MLQFALEVLFSFFALLILIFLGGRLLGLRIAFLRGLLTALLGLAAGSALAILGYRQGNGIGAILSSAGIFVFPLLFTMAFMVLGELLAKPGSLLHLQSKLMKPRHPLHTLRLRLALIRRYSQIVKIIARHGLSTYFSNTAPAQPARFSKLASSFRKTLQEAGGMFVKVGQLLSTRPDLFPDEVIQELSQLQDRVQPVPSTEIFQILAEELGPDFRDLFASIEPDPLAAASIAQVHRAQLISGEEVVVKVLRPGIQTLVERDMEIVVRLAAILENRTTWGKHMQVTTLAHGFAENIQEELDFRVEIRNLQTIADAMQRTPEVTVPRVFTKLSTERVLVMEWLDGVNIRQADQLIDDLQLDRIALARTLLECFLRQILYNGVFHADPHPGNILILRTGKPGLVDLGSVGRLDPLQQSALRSLLIAFQLRNSRLLTQAMLDLAEESDHVDEDRLERALAQFLVQRLGAHMPMDARVFTSLFALLQHYQLAFPPVIAGVFRSIVKFEWTLTLLAPTFSLLEEAAKLAPQFLREEIGFESLTKSLMSEALSLLPILHRLPRRLDRISAALEKGTLTTRTRLFSHADETSFARSLASNLIQAFLSAALGVIGVLFVGTPGGGSQLIPGISIFEVLGWICLFVSAVLMMRVIAITARDQVSQRK